MNNVYFHIFERLQQYSVANSDKWLVSGFVNEVCLWLV